MIPSCLVTARRKGVFHGHCFTGRFYWSLNRRSSCCSFPPILMFFAGEQLKTYCIIAKTFCKDFTLLQQDLCLGRTKLLNVADNFISQISCYLHQPENNVYISLCVCVCVIVDNTIDFKTKFWQCILFHLSSNKLKKQQDKRHITRHKTNNRY